MWEIPVYAAEHKDGLGEIIRANASIAYISPAKAASEEKIERLKEYYNRSTASANKGQIDLFYLDTILVTTGKNKNDDIFLKEPTWAARYTAEDKPFNYNHDQLDIIGHITSNTVVDDDYNAIANDTVIDDVPDKFHILTSAVIYKAWADKSQAERIATIIDEIALGKWYVSMECLFRGFDYCLTSSAGVNRIIARNADTAFLTKHLRSYGGKGVYNGESIGRVLSSINFSGKGLVENPANPESIIFQESEKSQAFKTVFANFEYKNLSNTSNSTGESNMDNEKTIAELQAKLDKATAEIVKLNEAQVAKASKESQDKIDGLTVAVDDAKKKQKEAEDKADAAEKELDKAKKDNEEKSKANDALKATIDAFKKADKVKSKGANASEAEAFLKEWDGQGLSEAAFDKVLDLAAPKFSANASEGSLPPPKNGPAKVGEFKPGEDKQEVNNAGNIAETGGNTIAAETVLEGAESKSFQGAVGYVTEEVESTRAEIIEHLEASRGTRRERRKNSKKGA